MLGLFDDRVDAGRHLGTALEGSRLEGAAVVGLARGGVPVGAEVARRLSLPLDVLAVRKVGHPWQPEYALGAVAPGPNGVYVRSHGGLADAELALIVERAKAEANRLDAMLHERVPPLDVAARTVVLVDDGLATGATMVAAVRWARGARAARVVVAVPVAAAQSLELLRRESDEVVCPHELRDFGAVGLWYANFDQVADAEVVALLEELRSPAAAA
ncbi:MAG: phosphoribosyltransferase family protein [Gaiella sp.]|nr:phosphoribosyltransferase family protein [Gaiella sp.]